MDINGVIYKMITFREGEFELNDKEGISYDIIQEINAKILEVEKGNVDPLSLKM